MSIYTITVELYDGVTYKEVYHEDNIEEACKRLDNDCDVVWYDVEEESI